MYKVIADGLNFGVATSLRMARARKDYLLEKGAKDVQIKKIKTKTSYVKKKKREARKPGPVIHIVSKNPLVKGYSPKAIGENIAYEYRKGKPHAQAIRIAYEIARREWKKKHPGEPYPEYLKGYGKFRKENPKHSRRKSSRQKYYVVAISPSGNKFYYNGTWFDSDKNKAFALPKSKAMKLKLKADREFMGTRIFTSLIPES